MAANNNLEHLDTLRKTLRNLTKHRGQWKPSSLINIQHLKDIGIQQN